MPEYDISDFPGAPGAIDGGYRGVLSDITGIHDASRIGYLPATPGNWSGGTDPGEVDDALNQLAGRLDGAAFFIAGALQYQHLEYDGSLWGNVTDLTLPNAGSLKIGPDGLTRILRQSAGKLILGAQNELNIYMDAGLGSFRASFVNTASGIILRLFNSDSGYIDLDSAFTGLRRLSIKTGSTTILRIQDETPGGTAMSNIQLDDNVRIMLGTGDASTYDAEIYYSGSNLVINPKLLGSGHLDVGGNGLADLRCRAIGCGTASPSSSAVLTMLSSGTAYSTGMTSTLTYSGSSGSVNGMNFTITHLGTSPSPTVKNSLTAYFGADPSTSGMLLGFDLSVGLRANAYMSQSAIHTYYAFRTTLVDNDHQFSHTNASFFTAGLVCPTIPSYFLGAGASQTKAAIVVDDDVLIASDRKLILKGSLTNATFLKGDSYLVYHASTTDIDLWVDGVKTMTWDDDRMDTFVPMSIVASSSSAAGLRLQEGAAPTSPVEGDVWNDSALNGLAIQAGGALQRISSLLFGQTASVTVTSTSETTLIGGGIGSMTLPASFLASGKTIRITAAGYYSSPVSPSTLRITVKKGSTVLFDFGAQTLPGSMTNRLWRLQAEFTARSSTTGIGQALFGLMDAAQGSPICWEASHTSIVSFSSSSQAIDLTAQFGAASHSITCSNLTMEIIG